MLTANQESIDTIHNLYKNNPSMMLHEMAHSAGVSEACVTYYLPEEIRSFASIEQFDAIWNAITEWEKATFILITKNAIVEVACKIPAGVYGHGFFNPMGDSPLGGHLKVSELGTIAFLSKPFFGLESHSIQFFDTKGDHAFAIYVGRENKQIIPSVKEQFLALKQMVSQ